MEPQKALVEMIVVERVEKTPRGNYSSVAYSREH